MVGDIASASRPDDFSRFEEPLHSPAQASYWSLMGLCGVSDARKVHDLSLVSVMENLIGLVWRKKAGNRAVN